MAKKEQSEDLAAGKKEETEDQKRRNGVQSGMQVCKLIRMLRAGCAGPEDLVRGEGDLRSKKRGREREESRGAR